MGESTTVYGLSCVERWKAMTKAWKPSRKAVEVAHETYYEQRIDRKQIDPLYWMRRALIDAAKTDGVGKHD